MIRPLQTKVFPSIGSQQASALPLQSSALPMQSTVIPATEGSTGLNIDSLVNLMITMMIIVMMMKMMTGAMSGIT